MISLEEWEEKTKLTEVQKQAVHDIQEACLDLPLPSSWYFEKVSAATTPPLIKKTPSTADLLASAKATTDGIDTLQSFFDWFANIESEMDQEDVYRDHLQKVQHYRQACIILLDHLQQTRLALEVLEKDYAFVSEKTSTVQAACESILKDQERLTHIADELSQRLDYFNHLEVVAKLLNAPGENVCLDPEFIPALSKLDECIEYMNQHPQYKDAELYFMRFKQYMTKAMTLIKMYVVSTIKSLGQEISKQNKDASITIGKQTTTCYVRFRVIAPTVKSLTSQIEKRAQDYQSLYDDILYTYAQTRQQLIVPIITRKLHESSDMDLLQLAKNGCAYMMNLCSDELVLFYSLFQPSYDNQLYQYLETLISHFYNFIWPRIHRENDTTVLSELCNIFSMYVMQDKQHYDEYENKRLKFGSLIHRLLSNTQAKLAVKSPNTAQ
ncbi:Sec34-domain-containing protein [Rhizopus microsporus var. microsporus]|uniref:Conserved oligomeric Golgi complex subunit 3 n=1 Tax=Rhizopus microsporus var. microsporus TaxID=86635 RepID=A0A1X0QYP0_RHIZD|nr:Sec34-domain-containing protein [Rhizopus microsporus var. microsporus]